MQFDEINLILIFFPKKKQVLVKFLYMGGSSFLALLKIWDSLGQSENESNPFFSPVICDFPGIWKFS